LNEKKPKRKDWKKKWNKKDTKIERAQKGDEHVK